MKNKTLSLIILFTLTTLTVKTQENSLNLVIKNYPVRPYTLSLTAKLLPFITGLGATITSHALGSEKRIEHSLGFGALLGPYTGLAVLGYKLGKITNEPGSMASNTDQQETLSIILSNNTESDLLDALYLQFHDNRYPFLKAYDEVSSLKSLLINIKYPIAAIQKNKRSLNYQNALAVLSQNLVLVNKALVRIKRSSDYFREYQLHMTAEQAEENKCLKKDIAAFKRESLELQREHVQLQKECIQLKREQLKG